MSSETNKALALRYYKELMNDGKLAFVDEFMAPEFIFTNPSHPEPYRGKEFKNLVSMLHSCFPDFRLRVEHLLAEEDTVVGHWIASGTHTGTPLETPGGDLPANGKSFEIDGMSWLRIVDGKFVEALINEDTWGLLQQLGILPAEAASREPTSTAQSKALVSRYFNEVMNQGKLEVIEEIMAPNFAFRIPTFLPEPIRDWEEMKGFVTRLRTSFPDIKYTIERQISEANKVAVRWFMEGTHQGEFLGIAPTGNQVKEQGVDLFIIAGGKIGEIWVNQNDFGLIEQLSAF